MTVYHKSPWLTISMPDADAETKPATFRFSGRVGSYDYAADSWREARRMLADEVRKELDALAALKTDEIEVEIASLGGSFRHALAIHDYLAQFPGRVTTRVLGMTASAATLIAQAGDVRLISANAMYLIHLASNEWVSGTVFDLQDVIDMQNEMNDRMAEIYAKRANGDAAVMRELMNVSQGKGRWLGAARVVELGLADEIFEPMDAAACAAPPPSALYGLPPLPEENQTEQTAQTIDHADPAADAASATAEAPAQNQSHTGDRDMPLTKEQLLRLKESFGADCAVAAVTEDMSFEQALDHGAEAIAGRLTDAEARVQTLTEQNAALTTERDALKRKVDAHASGLADPLGNGAPAGQAEGASGEDAEAEAKRKQDAEADASTRSALDSAFDDRD